MRSVLIKISLITLVLSLVLSVCSCKGEGADEESTNAETTETVFEDVADDDDGWSPVWRP